MCDLHGHEGQSDFGPWRSALVPLTLAAVCAFSFVRHISCCRPVKEKTFKIWNGIKGEFVDMTDTMLIEARTDPGAHSGCIEEGIDLVLQILTNHVGLCSTRKDKDVD
jgi:hypothetical protein